jgi:TP901 family phage tail tape measure protein
MVEVGKASVTLTVDDDKLKSGLNSAHREVEGWATEASKAGQISLGAITGASMAAGMMAVNALIGAADAIGPRAAMSWEKGMGSAIKTIGIDKFDPGTGEMSAAYKTLNKDLLDLRANLRGASQEDIYGTASSLGSLGIAQDQIKSTTQTVLQNAAAFGMSSDDTATRLATVNQLWTEQSTAMGGAANLFKSTGSAVNELGNKYSATERNILSFLSEAGGTAGVWDRSIADTAAFGALLETVGIKGPEAATALKSALNEGMFSADVETAKDTKGYKLAAQMLGIGDQAMKDRLNKDLYGTLIEVGTAVDKKYGADAAGKSQAFKKIFGGYGVELGTKIAGKGDIFAEMLGISNKGFEEGTSAQKEYGRQTDNLSGAVDELKGAFDVLSITAWSSSLGPAQGMVESLAEAIRGLTTGLATGDWSKFSTAIDSMKEKLVNWVSDIDFMGMGSDILTSIVNSLEGVNYDALGVKLLEVLKGAWNWATTSASGSDFELTDLITKPWNALKAIVGPTFTYIGNSIITSLATAAYAVQGAFALTWNTILVGAAGLVSGLNGLLSGIRAPDIKIPSWASPTSLYTQGGGKPIEPTSISPDQSRDDYTEIKNPTLEQRFAATYDPSAATFAGYRTGGKGFISSELTSAGSDKLYMMTDKGDRVTISGKEELSKSVFDLIAPYTMDYYSDPAEAAKKFADGLLPVTNKLEDKIDKINEAKPAAPAAQPATQAAQSASVAASNEVAQAAVAREQATTLIGGSHTAANALRLGAEIFPGAVKIGVDGWGREVAVIGSVAQRQFEQAGGQLYTKVQTGGQAGGSAMQTGGQQGGAAIIAGCQTGASILSSAASAAGSRINSSGGVGNVPYGPVRPTASTSSTTTASVKAQNPDQERADAFTAAARKIGGPGAMVAASRGSTPKYVDPNPGSGGLVDSSNAFWKELTAKQAASGSQMVTQNQRVTQSSYDTSKALSYTAENLGNLEGCAVSGFAKFQETTKGLFQESFIGPTDAYTKSVQSLAASYSGATAAMAGSVGSTARSAYDTSTALSYTAESMNNWCEAASDFAYWQETTPGLFYESYIGPTSGYGGSQSGRSVVNLGAGGSYGDWAPSFANEGYIASPMLAKIGDRPGGEYVVGASRFENAVSKMGQGVSITIHSPITIQGGGDASAFEAVLERRNQELVEQITQAVRGL